MTLIKVNFELHLNSPDSTSISVRRLIKIWETSLCNLINVSEAVLHAFNNLYLISTSTGNI